MLILKIKPAHLSYVFCLRLQTTVQEAEGINLVFPSLSVSQVYPLVFVIFFCHYEKKNYPDKKQVGEEFILPYSYRGIQSIMAGKVWQQEH